MSVAYTGIILEHLATGNKTSVVSTMSKEEVYEAFTKGKPIPILSAEYSLVGEMIVPQDLLAQCVIFMEFVYDSK